MKLVRILASAAIAALTLGLSPVAAFAASAAPATSSSQAPPTRLIVVRPVHSNGRPVAGYTVTSEKISGFTCDEGASPVAVDPNIRFCGYSATYTVACWKSPHHAVLCLRDPHSRTLVRIHYTGSFTHVAAPKTVTPEALRLGNTAFCSIRDGGAWGFPAQHPSWVGFYSCPKGQIYGPPSGDGINRSHDAWRVRVFGGSLQGPGTKQTVLKAYYVGTAS